MHICFGLGVKGRNKDEQKIFLKNYELDFSEKLLNKLIKYRNQRRRFIKVKKGYKKLVKFSKLHKF